MIASLNAMPLDNESNAFIKALLLGDKSSLDPSTKKAFSIAGATHVLAVSGLHVGIIVSLFSALLGLILLKIKKRKAAWIKSVLLLLVIWIYAGITDFSPSILRASMMFSFLSIGQSMTRHSNIYNTISIAAFFMLIINPDNLYAVGFQLSFMAVLGIIYFYPRLSRLFYFKNRLFQKIWNLCAVSIGAQITTFPLALYYFHQFPSYFLLSNLVVIPAAFIVLLLSILLLFLSWIPAVVEILSFALNKIISALHFCIHFIEKLPFSSVQHVYISLSQLLLLLGTLLFLTFFLNTKNVRHLYSSLFVCTLFFAAKIQHQVMTHQKQQVLVYSIAQETAIHVIDHLDHVLLLDHSPKDGIKKLSYASANFLQFKGLSSIEEAIKIQLGEPKSLVKPFLLSSQNHLIMHNTIVCLNHSSHRTLFKHLFKNRLLLKTKDFDLDTMEIRNYSHLIDNVWNKVTKEYGTPHNNVVLHHKIKSDGYFLLDLKN
jgi:competence protein ComEC